MSVVIIDDSTPNDIIYPPGMSRGYVERDFNVDPIEMFAPPSTMNLISRSEWDARIQEQEDNKSSLTHIRNRGVAGYSIPSLDQGNQGYCWSYSTGMCIMLERAKKNQPYLRLSPHAVACKIKDFKDQGGWCGLSAQFARSTGYPDISVWPERSMSKQYDNIATWQNAAQHKVTDDWVDIARPVYDQNLTFDQVASCLLRNQPCALDFNFWGHSVCGMRLVRVEAGSYGIEIINSWSDQWGTQGTAILRGSRALPNGAIGIVTTTIS